MAASEHLNPYGHRLKVIQAKEAVPPEVAEAFFKVLKQGKIPDWAFHLINFDLFKMATL